MIGNRRRQPFQTLFNLNLQQLTWLRETAKYLQTRVRRSNHGLESWAEQVREGFVLGFLEYHSPLLRLGGLASPSKQVLLTSHTTSRPTLNRGFRLLPSIDPKRRTVRPAHPTVSDSDATGRSQPSSSAKLRNLPPSPFIAPACSALGLRQADILRAKPLKQLPEGCLTGARRLPSTSSNRIVGHRSTSWHHLTRFSWTNCSRLLGSVYDSLVPHSCGFTSPTTHSGITPRAATIAPRPKG